MGTETHCQVGPGTDVGVVQAPHGNTGFSASFKTC